MKDSVDDETTGPHIGLNGHTPALQVICLGNSGGPSEANATGFLVRSVGSEWAKGSMLAVDAGSHLAVITRMLEQSFPSVSVDRRRKESNGSHASDGLGHLDQVPKPEPTVLSSGPFAGLKFPNESARANALHILRTFVSTYLITHPHLDHISGFAINTAAFHATSRPKTLAALPSTVNAIKEHIFNDIIWPNLTDEDGGVGFVTFQRLKEGGDLMLGEGEGRGYIDVCDGLGAKAFKVSHGTCTKSPPSHRHRVSVSGMSDPQPLYNGSIQGSSQDFGAPAHRSMSITAMHSTPGTPPVAPRQSFHLGHAHSPQLHPVQESSCVVDSTAYFLRDEYTQREVLIFGDVEPDSISLTPRTHFVWKEAARKIAHGMLGGIFIECSYDDSQADALLFGHLCPRHLIAELKELARMTVETKHALEAERVSKKRKRSRPNGLENFARNPISEGDRKRSRSVLDRTMEIDGGRRTSATGLDSAIIATKPSNESAGRHELRTVCANDGVTSPKSVSFPASSSSSSTTVMGCAMPSNDLAGSTEMPLTGIRIIIIHIKDTFRDGPHVSENILAQLREYELGLQNEGQGLGCEFVISRSGESYWF